MQNMIYLHKFKIIVKCLQHGLGFLECVNVNCKEKIYVLPKKYFLPSIIL